MKIGKIVLPYFMNVQHSTSGYQGSMLWSLVAYISAISHGTSLMMVHLAIVLQFVIWRLFAVVSSCVS
jgi:hypothetical protein